MCLPGIFRNDIYFLLLELIVRSGAKELFCGFPPGLGRNGRRKCLCDGFCIGGWRFELGKPSLFCNGNILLWNLSQLAKPFQNYRKHHSKIIPCSCSTNSYICCRSFHNFVIYLCFFSSLQLTRIKQECMFKQRVVNQRAKYLNIMLSSIFCLNAILTSDWFKFCFQ